MPNNYLILNNGTEYILRSMTAAMTTEVFLWITIAVFIFAIIQSLRGKSASFVAYAPTLLTSLGILGTFVGVIVGLLDFDAKNIDGSITGLLEGLKTAFITSIVGTGLSIIFKVLTQIFAFFQPIDKPNTIEVSGTGPDAIISFLKRIQATLGGDEESSLTGQLKLARADANDRHKETLRIFNQHTELLTKIRSNLADSEESSLIGQIRLLRFDFSDSQRKHLEIVEQDRKNHAAFANELWQRLGTFADMLSKSATEQVINALKEVIADFNNKLTEQFGQNFKELNTAVAHLVTWQENYRQQLEQMQIQYAQGVASITKTADAVADIADKSQHIPLTMDKLKNVLEVNQHQLAELERHLAAFRDMRDKAIAAIPTINQQIEIIVQAIESSVATASTHYQTLLNNSDKYIQDHDQQTRALLERFTNTTNTGIEQMSSGLNQGITTIANGIHSIQSHLTATSNALIEQTTSINEKLHETANTINNGTQTLAVTMSKEVDGIATILKEAGQKTQRDIQKIQQQVADNTKSMQQHLEQAIQESLAMQTQGMRTTLDNFYKEMNKSVLAITETTLNKVESAIQTASKHYQVLLDNSDKYIKQHDKQTIALLERFTTTTNEGIDKVHEGLTKGVKTIEATLKNGVEQLKTGMEYIQEHLDNTADALVRQTKTIEQNLAKTATTINERSQEFATVMTEEVRTIAEILKNAGQKTQRDIQQIQQQVADNIKSMQQHLDQAIKDSLAVQTQGMRTTLDNFYKEMHKAVLAITETTLQKVDGSIQLATEHYRKLLDSSTGYIKTHDDKTRELFDRFTTTTNEGIARINEGLIQGTRNIETTLNNGIGQFASGMQLIQGNLTNTSDTLMRQTKAIDDGLNKTVTTITSHAQELASSMTKESANISQILQKAASKTQSDIQQIQQQVADNADKMKERFDKVIQESIAAHTRAMSSASDVFNKELSKVVSNTGEGMNKQLLAIDEAMAKEVKLVMTEMGNALAKIATRFTSDYKQLVEAMQEVLKTTRNLI